MNILVKSTKTGKAKTLLVFSFSQNKVSKIDVKIHLSPAHLFELISRIERKLKEFATSEDKRIDLKEYDLYLIRQQTKVFDLPKAQLYQQNIKFWNELYERYMSNIYDEPLPSEKRLFEQKKYDYQFMETFFKSEEWYAKDKTIGRFCANEKNILSTIHKNSQPNYSKEADYEADRLL